MGVEDSDLVNRLDRPRLAVLGPVEIRTGVAIRALRGKSARLLAGLAASPAPRTIEQLAATLWGADLPPTHRAALHVHLGALRKVLHDTQVGASIQRVGDGYALSLDGCELDATLAQDAVRILRDVLPADPATAAKLADQVLHLWRGDPFAVDGEPVDGLASHRAAALRRDAEELLVDALLAAGDARRAEAEAARLVAEEPLRETRWGQLLRARYLTGGSADALVTFQEARTTLIEAMGIEPGHELRGLEAAALTHDRASLALPPTHTPTTFHPPPPPVGLLIGRSSELQHVRARLARHESVVILGPPGVGKSRLALEVTRDATATGVAWIDLRTADPRATVEDLSEWVRLHPDGLVVLDNLEARPEMAVAAVALRQRAPTVKVLITSRVPVTVGLPVETLEPLELPAADADAAQIEDAPATRAMRAALAELAPSASLSTDELAQLCRRSGGLPLVLRLLAGAARALPASALTQHALPVVIDEVDHAVDSVLALVSASARNAFADLAVVVGDFDVALGAAVVGVDEARFSAIALELVDHGLLQARPELARPYSMLEPIRDAASRALGAGERRDRALSRHADACITLARQLEEHTATDRRGLEEAVVASLPHLRAALDHLVRTRDAERALRLVCHLEGPLYTLGWWAEGTELLDLAIAVEGPKSQMRARAHALRARPGPLHLFDPWHAERAECIALELDRPLLVAFARHIRAVGAWWRGDVRAAIDLSDAAAESFAAAGRTWLWSEARKFLGVAMVFDGDAAGGLQVQQEALAALRRTSAPPFRVGHGLAYLGHCQRMLGDDDGALGDWIEARELCRSVANRGTAIHIELGLGDLAVDRNDIPTALAHAAAALDLIHDTRAWTYEPWAWTVALRAHAAVGDTDLAAVCGRRATRALPHAPSGEAVRLAQELAQLAIDRDEPRVAARLLRVTETLDDLRELPFAPPAERRRLETLGEAVADRLGPAWRADLAAGPTLSITEAAGALLPP